MQLQDWILVLDSCWRCHEGRAVGAFTIVPVKQPSSVLPCQGMLISAGWTGMKLACKLELTCMCLHWIQNQG